jgi:hypothetical protein
VIQYREYFMAYSYLWCTFIYGILSCYIEHLDSLRLRHARQLKSWMVMTLQSCLVTSGVWSKEYGTIQMLKVEVWNVPCVLSSVFLLTY